MFHMFFFFFYLKMFFFPYDIYFPQKGERGGGCVCAGLQKYHHSPYDIHTSVCPTHLKAYFYRSPQIKSRCQWKA